VQNDGRGGWGEETRPPGQPAEHADWLCQRVLQTQPYTPEIGKWQQILYGGREAFIHQKA